MKVKEKIRLIQMMDELADVCCGIAFSREVAREKMHPDFHSRRRLMSKDELCEFMANGLTRLGLHTLVGECERLADLFERDLSKAPGEITRLFPGERAVKAAKKAAWFPGELAALTPPPLEE